MPATLTRIVTCFRQWPQIAHWIKEDDLFAEEIAWIVVNDAPDDRCPAELAERLARREVTVVTPEFNQGRCAARNLGVRHAASAWIEHIDGDDLPLPVMVARLPAVAAADVLQFPTPEIIGPMVGITDRANFMKERPHCENWSPLLPALRPFDVRLTSTLWRREFFLQLGGYDSRFEGIEDVQLAFKASLRAARVSRLPQPKQVYCRRLERETLRRLRIEGSLCFLHWVKTEYPDHAPAEIAGWIAKDNFYLTLSTLTNLVRNPGGLFRYIRWRWF